MKKIGESQRQLEKDYLADQKMVKGVFNFKEVPGGRMSFVYKKYKQDRVKKYDMVDGQVYTVPLGVAKHLNRNGWYPVHENRLDENDKNVVRIGQRVNRFGFQALDFGVSEDLSDNQMNNIVTVETIR